jgi:prophage antirepressor-like protein
MPSITQYNFGDNRLRVILDEHGEPWFPASDACRVLGMNYEKNGTGHYVEHIAEKHKRGLGTMLPRTPSNELPPHTTVLSEAGLYQLILKSRKPEAVRFQEWVTDEVLPSIRKTGSYVHKASSAPEPVLMTQARELTEEAVEKVVAKAFGEAAEKLRAEVLSVMGQFAPRRREVPASVRELHRRFVATRGYRCPCCDQVKSSWADFNVDHFKDRQDPSLTATWGICADCNQSLKDAASHKDSEPAFLAYQRWMSVWRMNTKDVCSSELQADLF